MVYVYENSTWSKRHKIYVNERKYGQDISQSKQKCHLIIRLMKLGQTNDL